MYPHFRLAGCTAAVYLQGWPDKMSPDKMSRRKCRGQNVMWTKCHWTNCRGQNAVDNMLWTKCRGQNDSSFWPITFCPHNILSATLCPWHFVRWHFVLEPLQAIYMRHANVSPASPSDPQFFIWLSSEPPFQSPNFWGGVSDPYPRWFVFRSNCSTKKFSEIMWINKWINSQY